MSEFPQSPIQENQRPAASTDNLPDMLSQYYQSEEYNNAYNAFYEGKNLGPQVSPNLKKSVFLQQEQARIGLIQFAKDKLHYNFNPKDIPEEALPFLEYYLATVDEYKNAINSHDKDRIINADSDRTNSHNAFAAKLSALGVAPSQAIGVGIANLILIDKGLQEFPSALANRQDRLKGLF